MKATSPGEVLLLIVWSCSKPLSRTLLIAWHFVCLCYRKLSLRFFPKFIFSLLKSNRTLMPCTLWAKKRDNQAFSKHLSKKMEENKRESPLPPLHHKSCDKFTVVSVIDRWTWIFVHTTDHQFLIFFIHCNFSSAIFNISLVHIRVSSLSVDHDLSRVACCKHRK